MITITVGQGSPRLHLGRQGENEARRIAFDISAMVAEYGEGIVTLTHKRPRDGEAYPVVLDVDGTTATWTVTSADTAQSGSGEAQLTYTVGGVIAKSVIYGTRVSPSITVGEDVPDPYVEWFERIIQLIEQGSVEGVTYTLSQDAEDPLTLILTSSKGDVQRVTLPAIEGPQGPQGIQGEPGPAYTLTAEDKADIVDDVLDAMSEEVTITTDGGVTQELAAGKVYHFTGDLTALTITLGETTGLAQYHFDFLSGATAPTVTIPASVTMPDSFSVEANTRVEVDILNGYGVAQSWAVSE